MRVCMNTWTFLCPADLSLPESGYSEDGNGGALSEEQSCARCPARRRRSAKRKFLGEKLELIRHEDCFFKILSHNFRDSRYRYRGSTRCFSFWACSDSEDEKTLLCCQALSGKTGSRKTRGSPYPCPREGSRRTWLPARPVSPSDIGRHGQPLPSGGTAVPSQFN